MEAEQSLLGSLLIDQDAMIKIGDVTQPEDFYRDSHRLIYDCMLDLSERHEPIDILTVGNRLEEKGKLQHIGGRTYLVELSNAVPTSAHIVHYAQIIQKKASLRRLIEAATNITRLGYDEEGDIDETLDEAERTLFRVSQNLTKNAFVPISRVLTEAFDRIDELHRESGKLRGLVKMLADVWTDAANALGLDSIVDAVAGEGEGFVELLRLAGASAAGANAINNLPAYLALESIAGTPDRMAAVLIGVNAGSLVTPWASLATMMWHSRLVSLGVDVSWGRYAALGLLVMPLTVVAAVAALVAVP